MYSSKKINLQTRLEKIVSDLEKKVSEHSNTILNRIIENKDLFVKQIKWSRNYYTHYSLEDKKRALQGKDLFYLSEKLKIVLVCALLVEVGFSKNEIEMVLEQYWRRYTYLVIERKS